MDSSSDTIVYNSPQDKLLIMLLERVENLEDEVRKSNENVERLLKHVSSHCFSVVLTGYNYTDISTVIETIMDNIQKHIPCKKIHTRYYSNNIGCLLTFVTVQNWLLDTVIEKLDGPLRKLVHLNSWTRLENSPEYIHLE